MAALEKNRTDGVAVKKKKPRRAMAVILKGIPGGHNRGWYSREEPRMHLQSVEEKHDFKVWLEEKGERAFEPVSKVPAKVLQALRQEVSAHRLWIEDRWVRFMIDKDWLALHVALPKLTLVAYPNTPNKFVRVIDLSTWFNQRLLATLTPDIIELNREMAALRLWNNRHESDTYDARLSRLLWGKELTGP